MVRKSKEELINEAKSLGLGDLSYMPEPVLLDIMESGEAEWHKARKMGIGGSDAGAVMGYNHYVTPAEVALSKLSNKQKTPPTADSQYRLDCGHDLESTIVKLYARRMGFYIPLEDEKNPSLSGIKKITDITQVEWDEHKDQGLVCVDRAQYRHPLHPFMFGDCDALAIMPNGEKIGIEVKTYDYRYKDSWKSGVYDGTNKGGVVKNPEYAIQVAHYMSVLNLNRFDLLANCGTNPDDLTVVTFYRDLELEAKIIAKEEEFWTNLQKGIIPSAPKLSDTSFDRSVDLLTNNELEDTSINLPKALLANIAEIAEVNEKIAVKNEELKSLEERKNALCLPIIQSLDSHSKGYLDIDSDYQYEVNYKGTKRESLDSSKLKIAEPEIYEAYKKVSVSKPSLKYKKVKKDSYAR